MKTQCASWARPIFPFSPDWPTSASSRPATPQRPIHARPPSPIPARCTARLRRAWVGALARPLFSSLHRSDQPHPLSATSPCLVPRPDRPPPLKSRARCIEMGPLHHRHSLSPFPLPHASRAPLCLSLLSSCPGSTVKVCHRVGIGATPPLTPPLR
jgi:hypothetical protein